MVGKNYIFTTEGHPLPVLSAWHEKLPETYIPSNWTSFEVLFLTLLHILIIIYFTKNHHFGNIQELLRLGVGSPPSK